MWQANRRAAAVAAATGGDGEGDAEGVADGGAGVGADGGAGDAARDREDAPGLSVAEQLEQGREQRLLLKLRTLQDTDPVLKLAARRASATAAPEKTAGSKAALEAAAAQQAGLAAWRSRIGRGVRGCAVEVEADGSAGEVEADDGAGEVEVDGSAGEVEADGSAGEVEADGGGGAALAAAAVAAAPTSGATALKRGDSVRFSPNDVHEMEVLLTMAQLEDPANEVVQQLLKKYELADEAVYDAKAAKARDKIKKVEARLQREMVAQEARLLYESEWVALGVEFGLSTEQMARLRTLAENPPPRVIGGKLVLDALALTRPILHERLLTGLLAEKLAARCDSVLQKAASKAVGKKHRKKTVPNTAEGGTHSDLEAETAEIAGKRKEDRDAAAAKAANAKQAAEDKKKGRELKAQADLELKAHDALSALVKLKGDFSSKQFSRRRRMYLLNYFKGDGLTSDLTTVTALPADGSLDAQAAAEWHKKKPKTLKTALAVLEKKVTVPEEGDAANDEDDEDDEDEGGGDGDHISRRLSRAGRGCSSRTPHHNDKSGDKESSDEESSDESSE